MFDIEKASREKGMIQENAIMLSDKYFNLLLAWATGTSKTLTAIRIIENLRSASCLYPKIYIVLKETNHEQNWRDEFSKWGLTYLLTGVTFLCYASLHKYVEEEVDILILDECHALSEMREDYLKTIKCDKIISLSATVGEEVKKRIKAYKTGFYEYHISLQTAIDRGILPEPKIYVVYVDLENTKKVFISPWTKKPKGGGAITARMMTAKEYYKELSKKIDWFEEQIGEADESGEQNWIHNRWIQIMGLRKKFIAKAKTDAAQLLLQYLADKRYICFCGSIEQADELGGSLTIHSKISKKEIEESLNLFQKGKTRHIYAVGMLRESMNLNGIEAAIIVQLDNQSGSAEQMIGRSLRSIAPEVYILILRGTKDEDYFDRATRGIGSQYISEYIWPKDE